MISLRVLLISPGGFWYFNPFGLAHFYFKAFLKCGVTAYLHHYLKTYPANYLSKVSHKLLRPYLLNRAERELISVIKVFRPDLTIVTTMGYELGADLLDEIKRLSGGLVFVILSDNPVDCLQPSYIEALKRYDCVFVFGKFLVPILYLHGISRVEYLPFAHDPETHRPNSVSNSEWDHYSSPIAYLGAWGRTNQHWLELLVPFGLKIWGEHWEKLPLVSPLRGCWQRPGPNKDGMGPKMPKVCNASSIIFNVVRAEHGCAHSMKTFEIPACRGFLLSNRASEQLEFLDEDKCAVYFSTREELLDKVKFYLQRDDLRAKIAEEGWKRVQGHTYTERAKYILQIYEEMRSK